MSKLVLKAVIQSLFAITSRAKASRQADKALHDYLELAEQIEPIQGCTPVKVPPMRGVDEDMRGWSFYQILAHNGIVAHTISAIVNQLAVGETLHGAAVINPKTDVMPATDVGEEQVARLRDEVDKHLAMVGTLGTLRGGATTPHPLFGTFDAHRWHCMFAFHLKIHLDQARYVVSQFATENKS